MSEYVKKMRAVFPSRSGKTPGICQELEAYDWEDVQEHLFESVLDHRIVSVVDDSKASTGKAVRLVGSFKSLQVRSEISHLARPCHHDIEPRCYAPAAR